MSTAHIIRKKIRSLLGRDERNFTATFFLAAAGLAILAIAYTYVTYPSDQRIIPPSDIYAGVPKNYAECVRTDTRYRKNTADTTELACIYTIDGGAANADAPDKRKYDACNKIGGGAADDNACQLVFLNHAYQFPKNNTECIETKMATLWVSEDAKTPTMCAIMLDVNTVYDEDEARAFTEKCEMSGGATVEGAAASCVFQFTDGA